MAVMYRANGEKNVPIQSATLSGSSTAAATGETYKASFVNFIVVQGFFAGLATGKMSEGALMAGLKHSLLLITIGYTLFSFASEFQFSLF